jgi:hypothetical protein
MGDPPIFRAAEAATNAPNAGAAGTSVPQPAPVNPQEDLQTQIDRMIAERVQGLQGVIDQLKKRAEEAEKALRQARHPGPNTAIPLHGAGPGTANLQTWGQYYQDLAAKGELTAAHIAQADGIVPDAVSA